MVNAQEDKKPQFLFQDGNMLVSGFGGPIAEFWIHDNSFAMSNGGGGAVLLNQRFFIGGYGMGLSTRHFREDLKGLSTVQMERPMVCFNHGGLWLGAVFMHHKTMHFGFSTKLGGGEIALIDEYFDSNIDERKAVDKVFVVTPQIEFEMNLTPWMKFNAGLGYRYVGGIDRFYQYSNDDFLVHFYYDKHHFNAPFLSAGFQFGWFDQSK